jgi:serine/threonine protein phosphatase PrpC
MMMEQIKTFTINNRWVRLLALGGLIVASALLVVIADGFPPWAWRFLIQLLPQLPRLWAAQGGAMVVPFIGLILLSLSLLLAWGMIVVLVYKILSQWWMDYHARQHFQLDLQEAERLSEQNLRAAHEEADLSALFESDPGNSTSIENAPPLMRYNRSYQRQPISPLPRPREFSPAAPRIPNPPFAPATPNPVSPAALAQQFSPAPVPPSPAPQQAFPPAASAPTPFAQPFAPAAQANLWQPQISLPATRSNVAPARPALVRMPDEEQRIVANPNPQLAAYRSPQRQQLRVVPPPDEFDEEIEFEIAHTQQAADKTSAPNAQPTGGLSRTDISRLPTRPEWLPQEAPIEDEPGQYQAHPRHDVAQMQHSLLPPAEPPVNTDLELETTLPIRKEDQAARRQPAGETRADPPSESDSEAHTAPVRLVVGIGLDPGIARRNHPNEDSLFAIQGLRITDTSAVPAGLFVVADGMGGHANGREASKLAIQTVSDAIVPTLLREASGTSIIDEEELFLELLKDGVHRANLAIYQRNREMPEMMGTTITAALVVDNTAYIANIGDSRTYLYRADAGLYQVTRDHSRVAQMVELGLITRDEIYTHPQRNQINRCLGESASAKVDTFIEYLQPDDVLLLCSDGLWEMVHDPDIEHIISSSTPHNAAQISSVLVQAALHRGGADNISLVVVGAVKSTE